MNDAELVEAYLRNARSRTAGADPAHCERFDAWEELDILVSKEPERAWPIICDIIGQCPDDAMLASVAAGPLEDLLCRHPSAFIDRVETRGKQDAHFRRAVSGVWGWGSMPDDVRKRLDDLLGDEPRL